MNAVKNSLLKKNTIIFILFVVAAFAMKPFLISKGFDFMLLVMGNLFLFVIFIISAFIHSHAASSVNPHVFLRSINLTMIIKMFSSALAVFIFVMINNGQVNKESIFTLLGLYIIYTSIEVGTLMKALKSKNGQERNAIK